MWTTRELTDKTEILSFLEQDRPYAAYAIGDLEPGLFEQCTWAGAEREGRLEALALVYRGLDPPALFLMSAPSSVDDSSDEDGDPEAGDGTSPASDPADGSGLKADAQRAILAEALHPPRVYITCRPEHLKLAQEFYDWQTVVPMWRMALPRGRFRAVDSSACQRLPAEDAPELAAFYDRVGAVAFGPDQVGRGVYYGLRIDDRLVAVAGTHLVSSTYGVAAVGNVYTDADHRGQGFGTMTTSAVVTELLTSGIGDIVLNVGQENRVARRIYERLGFLRHCAFLEGLSELR